MFEEIWRWKGVDAGREGAYRGELGCDKGVVEGGVGDYSFGRRGGFW